MTIEVRVPTLGESVTEATVATWFKKPGEPVAADEMLCELETDKVTVEVPAPAAGTMGEIVAAEGETVGVDALLATGAAGDGTEICPPMVNTADEVRWAFMRWVHGSYSKRKAMPAAEGVMETLKENFPCNE